MTLLFTQWSPTGSVEYALMEGPGGSLSECRDLGAGWRPVLFSDLQQRAEREPMFADIVEVVWQRTGRRK